MPKIDIERTFAAYRDQLAREDSSRVLPDSPGEIATLKANLARLVVVAASPLARDAVHLADLAATLHDRLAEFTAKYAPSHVVATLERAGLTAEPGQLAIWTAEAFWPWFTDLRKARVLAEMLFEMLDAAPVGEVNGLRDAQRLPAVWMMDRPATPAPAMAAE
jgi:hypothetical protein